MKEINSTIRYLFAFSLLLVGCSETEDKGLANYEGQRPLEFVKVTQSEYPEIQWLGGRVAAVGINKGSVAALDSTLVWVITDVDNSIESPIYVKDQNDEDLIAELGGTPFTKVSDSEKYTFWLAEEEPFEADLDTSLFDGFNYVDMALTFNLILKGKAGGEEDAQDNLLAEISIRRDESLEGVEYIVSWEPSTEVFRQLAIRNATSGGFTDLLYHIVTVDSLEPQITSPHIIGESIAGVDEVIAFPAEGLKSGRTYFLWMTNDTWRVGTFSPTSRGLSWFRIYPF